MPIIIYDMQRRLLYLVIRFRPYIHYRRILSATQPPSFGASCYRRFNQISALLFCLPDIIIMACDCKLWNIEIERNNIMATLKWQTVGAGGVREQSIFGDATTKIMPYSPEGCHIAKPNPKLIELCECLPVYVSIHTHCFNAIIQQHAFIYPL